MSQFLIVTSKTCITYLLLNWRLPASHPVNYRTILILEIACLAVLLGFFIKNFSVATTAWISTRLGTPKPFGEYRRGVMCKDQKWILTGGVRGLKTDELESLEKKLTGLNLISSKQEHFFEVDTQGIRVLNILCGDDYNYRISSQSMAMEKTDIGGRTIQVQKMVWTLGKQ